MPPRFLAGVKGVVSTKATEEVDLLVWRAKVGLNSEF
jgi:hypothetical protein